MAYILALAIGFGSLALYMAAFFFPEIYRKGDFFWSGVGMFYALILWFCAGRITGAVLLGQLAVVAIVLWFGWQILMLRRSLTPVAEQTQIKEDLKEQLAGGLSGLPQLVKTGLKKDESTVAPDATAESEISGETEVAPASEAIAPEVTDSTDESGATDSEAGEQPQTDEARDPNASAEAPLEKKEEPVKPEKQKQRGFLGLGNLLASVTSRAKKQPKSQPDQKITSSDSPADETAETIAPTAVAPVPDGTASETIALSEVETREAATEVEQATVPEPEETIEPVTEPEQATAPEPEKTIEPVTEPEQATAPEPEETLTGAEAAQKEETSEQASTSESGSQSAEIKAKTDDVS